MVLSLLLVLASPCTQDSDCQDGLRCIASSCQSAVVSQPATTTKAPTETLVTGKQTATGSQPVDHKRYEFTLANGSVLVGRIMTAPDPRQVRIQLIDGTVRTIFREDIVRQQAFRGVKIGADGNVWEDNPNRTRHIYAPSAMPLQKGEGYVSLKEFLFGSAAYGISDNVSILVGSFLPTLFAGLDVGGLIGAVKISGEIGDNTYLAGGVEVITLPGSDSFDVVGIGFGAITMGKPDKQFTISAGRPFVLSTNSGSNDLGDLLLVAAGQLRVSNTYGIVTENWFFPTADGPEGGFLRLHSLVVRKMGQQSAFDFGFIGVGGVPVLLPWVDWTWNLGKARSR